MQDATREFRIHREEVPGETIGIIRSPRLTDACITEYTSKMLQAVEASSDPDKTKRFVDRARDCSIHTTVRSYEMVFDRAVRSFYKEIESSSDMGPSPPPLESEDISDVE